MAVRTRAFTLTETVAQQIVEPDEMPHDVIIHNETKSSNEYVLIGGGSAVAVGSANSMHIDPGETYYMTLHPGDELWATSDPSGLVVQVLDIRKGE